MKLYRYLSKDLLTQNNYEVRFKDDGTPMVFSYKQRESGKELKPAGIQGPHKHSRNVKPYLYYLLTINGTPSFYSLSRIVWAWVHGQCPCNMTVDHIDNKHDAPYDNRASNLQLLTLKENLAKKKQEHKVGRNQHTWHMTDEEILEKREEKKKRGSGVAYRRRLRETRDELLDKKSKLKDEICSLESPMSYEDSYSYLIMADMINKQIHDIDRQIKEIRQEISDSYDR